MCWHQLSVQPTVNSKCTLCDKHSKALLHYLGFSKETPEVWWPLASMCSLQGKNSSPSVDNGAATSSSALESLPHCSLISFLLCYPKATVCLFFCPWNRSLQLAGTLPVVHSCVLPGAGGACTVFPSTSCIRFSAGLSF